MNALAAALLPHQLERAVGDYFVGVHVGRSAGAGLKNIHDEFLVVLAVHDFLRGPMDHVGGFFVQQTEVAVRRSGGVLDQRQRADKSRWKADAANGEIFHRALRLGAVVSALWNLDFAHGVSFDAVLFGHCFLPKFFIIGSTANWQPAARRRLLEQG
jgi:hypothetical protein